MSNCKLCLADCAFKGKDMKKGNCKGYIPMSNADRIRAMSDEELAVFLDGFTCNCIDCRDNDGKNKSCPIYNRQRCRYCEPKDIMDWLQSPEEEDT